MTSSYRCDHCGGTFNDARHDSHEKRLAEERKVFGENAPESERGILCDPCYKAFRAWFDQLSPSQRADLRRRGLS
jgi:hypothetical protein